MNSGQNYTKFNTTGRNQAFSHSPPSIPVGMENPDAPGPMNTGYVSNLSEWRDSDASKKYCESPVIRNQINTYNEQNLVDQTAEDAERFEALSYILNNQKMVEEAKKCKNQSDLLSFLNHTHSMIRNFKE